MSSNIVHFSCGTSKETKTLVYKRFLTLLRTIYFKLFKPSVLKRSLADCNNSNLDKEKLFHLCYALNCVIITSIAQNKVFTLYCLVYLYDVTACNNEICNSDSELF